MPGWRRAASTAAPETDETPGVDAFIESRHDREPWRLQAACRGMGWDLFFPVRGQGRPPKAAPNPAAEVCARCPVTVECDALRAKIDRVEGVWGGVEYRRGVPLHDYYRTRG